MASIELRNVEKRYGDTVVVPDLCLAIEDGELVVLVGPSGCGKSTLLRMIAGLLEPTGGRILIDGKDVTDLAPGARDIAMVFQSYALYPHMTVFENIAFPLRVRRLKPDEVTRRVGEVADTLGLASLLERRPRDLSGGQRQRVAMGRAIVREPKAFLFDEPLSNLDAALRARMRAEVATMHREMAATMIYVTHDQHEAMTLADRLVLLKGGVIEQEGRPLDVYRNPDSRFVGEFMGSPPMNFLPAEVDGDLARCEGYTAALPALGGPPPKSVWLGMRPEDLELAGEDASNALDATVEWVERTGSEGFLYVKAADAEMVVRLAADTPQSFAPGDSLRLTCSRVLLFDRDSGRRMTPSSSSLD